MPWDMPFELKPSKSSAEKNDDATKVLSDGYVVIMNEKKKENTFLYHSLYRV